ncbi:hypothetical protein OAE53_01670, partial [bacterium]|nr:hypothetical protein [bacterium]
AAQICKDDERLFIPTFSDFRGRTFPRGVALTFQGRDFQKALLNFADAKEVDERTDYWMRISMSADMDLDKLSYEKRCAAIEANRENIINSVRDPIGCDWWKQQASPWMLLHVATEWVRLFVDNDSNRTTKCRVSIDCTCSGQQLMAGWTRSMATAVQVNLVPADEPADVYGNVLDVAVRGMEGDNFCVEYKSKRTTQPMPKGKLKGLGTDIPEHRKQARKGAKGIIMVGQYGAGRKKRIEEFADNCQLKWLGDKGNFLIAEAAALYPYFKDGLDECLPAMDVFLKWAQGVVSAAFKSGREFILIPTADGSCIKQLYPKFNKERIQVDHLGGMTLGKRRNEHVATNKEEPDTEKHVSSTAANFVHAGDGAVLVLALTDIGIPFSTCHDSVSGRPSKDMDLIFDRMRTGMYLVFTSSVCRDFVEANGLKWEDHKLIDYGTYDPELVLKADYALC